MVIQYRAPWSVPNAGPSVSTFHFEGNSAALPDGLAAAVRGFFNAIKSTLPNDVIVNFASEMTIHDETNGQLVGTIPVTPPAAVQGDLSGSWAGGAGYRVDWLTSAIRNGRRVRGRTFIVPASATVFSNEGRVLGATATTANTAGQGLIATAATAGNNLVVWSRPGPGGGGQIHTVTDPATSTLAATLRGRKY